MEQRTTITVYVILLALLAMSLARQTFAEPPDTVPTQIGRADLEAAMRDADQEYEAVLKMEAATRTPPVHSNTASLKAVKSPKTPEGGLLKELASQVDILNNKLIIERTTLLATQSPRKVKVRGARTVFNYSPEALYEVTSSVDHITDVQLKPGESLNNAPTAGDTVRWNVATMKSGTGPQEVVHVILKPLDELVETNLIITTDLHTYHLRLKSGDYHMPAVSWNYPEDFAAQADEIVKRKNITEQTVVTPDSLRFAYQIEDQDYPWRPVRVFDDGKKTFIQMPSTLSVADAPALFIIEDSSQPMLVNYRVKGDFYIVDRLFTEAELRVGTRQKIGIKAGTHRNFFQRLFE